MYTFLPYFIHATSTVCAISSSSPSRAYTDLSTSAIRQVDSKPSLNIYSTKYIQCQLDIFLHNNCKQYYNDWVSSSLLVEEIIFSPFLKLAHPRVAQIVRLLASLN